MQDNACLGEHTGPTIQLVEVLIFLSLIVPSMVIDFFVFRQQQIGFGVVAWATMVRDIALVGLILFFLWRAGEPVRMIGWTTRHAWKEALLGIVLFLPFFFATSALDRVFRQLGLGGAPTHAYSALHPHGTAQLILASVLVIVVAISEETMFRGYLLLRFASLTRSLLVALVLSCGIFALGHRYEGEAGLATVGVMGFIFALVYVWRKSLIAPIVMHFLQDFLGIVLVGLLTSR